MNLGHSQDLGPKPPSSGSCTVLLAQPPWISWALPSSWHRILPTAKPVGIKRLGFQTQLYLLQIRPGHVWDLRRPQFLLYSRVPQPLFLLSHLPLHLKMGLQPPCASAVEQVERGFQPHSRRRKDMLWGKGPSYGLGPSQRDQPLCLSCFHPIKPRMCWCSAQGGLEGFPHTVLRCFANESSGDGKCSPVCVCQCETGHSSQN